MLNTLLGTKQKMSQTFVEGTRVPITWINVGPCVVTQIKNPDTDGYWSVQLGYGKKEIKNITKPLQGHLRGVTQEKKAPRFLREIRLENKPDLKVGDILKLVDVFKVGDLVNITGISKGKGFAGVVKRWHFAGGPKTHGQSDRLRAPGSIGQGTTPGRVYKGKHMAGRMGQDRVTIKNLIVAEMDSENDKLAISGPVPGSPGSLLFIKKVASGKLEELVEEAPEIKVQEIEVKEEEKKESEEVKNE